MLQLPACPSTNGKLDFPCLQIFKLKVLSASKAPPYNTPVPKDTAFFENTKPMSPPLKTIPPGKKKNTFAKSCISIFPKTNQTLKIQNFQIPNGKNKNSPKGIPKQKS